MIKFLEYLFVALLAIACLGGLFAVTEKAMAKADADIAASKAQQRIADALERIAERK